MPTSKPKTNLFDDWSNAELHSRQARYAYQEATEALVNRIIENNGPWPCADSDPEFVSVESEEGPVMLELRPYDFPHKQPMPFYIHHLEVLKL